MILNGQLPIVHDYLQAEARINTPLIFFCSVPKVIQFSPSNWARTTFSRLQNNVVVSEIKREESPSNLSVVRATIDWLRLHKFRLRGARATNDSEIPPKVSKGGVTLPSKALGGQTSSEDAGQRQERTD
jgi:hypothetical protein